MSNPSTEVVAAHESAVWHKADHPRRGHRGTEVVGYPRDTGITGSDRGAFDGEDPLSDAFDNTFVADGGVAQRLERGGVLWRVARRNCAL